MDTFIHAEQNWGLWTLLLGIATLGLWSERLRLGAQLSGAVMTLLAGFVLSNLKIMPIDAPVYHMVWTYVVPIAIPLLLFQANIRGILKETIPTLAAFSLGVVGALIGVLSGYFLLPLGEHGWQVAAMFAATYIGGMTNYHPSATLLQLSDQGLLESGLAAHHLIILLYFLVLFSLPAMRRLRNRFHDRPLQPWGSTTVIVSRESSGGERVRLPTLATAVTLSIGITALGNYSEKFTTLQGTSLLVITLMTILLATLLPKAMQHLDGARDLGILMMYVFFATIGVSANIAIMAKSGALLFVFAGMILLVHLLVLLIAGRFLKLTLPEIVIASNAAVGGPATAAAMASARRWDPLIVSGILCGTLGYAFGTDIGVALGNLLR